MSLIEKIKSKVPLSKKSGKKVFWIWVGYQAVKGTATTILIWIPIWHLWLKG